MLGVYTIVEARDYGWGSPHTLGLGALAVALLAAFIVREARTANPLMPLRMFRSRNVVGREPDPDADGRRASSGCSSSARSTCSACSASTRSRSASRSCRSRSASGCCRSAFSARLILRFGARATLIPGLALIVAGLALFARAPVDGSYWVDVLPAMLLLGIGAGLRFPALMTLAMSGATPERLGPGVRAREHHRSRSAERSGWRVLATLSTTRTRQPARRRRVDCRGAHERLPPRVRDRSRSRGGRAQPRRLGAPFPHERRAGGARLPGRAPVRGGVGRRRRAVPEAALRRPSGGNGHAARGVVPSPAREGDSDHRADRAGLRSEPRRPARARAHAHAHAGQRA